MKLYPKQVLVIFLLSLSWCGLGSARPLIADVLRAASMENGGGGSMHMDPLHEETNYSYQYVVKDPETGNDFGHSENRMDGVATGSFHMMMPDGRMQRVNYVADEDGYRPIISFEGEAMYGPGMGVRMGSGGQGGREGQMPMDIRGF